MSTATGISASRYAAIENGRKKPNPTERDLIERFLRSKFEEILLTEGPIPDWLQTRDTRKVGAGRLGD